MTHSTYRFFRSNTQAPLALAVALTLAAFAAAPSVEPSTGSDGLSTAHKAQPEVHITFGEPQLEEPSPEEVAAAVASCSGLSLSECLRAQLPPPRSKHARSRQPLAANSEQPSTAGQWTCRNWEPLWQGSGQGRNCEWL